MTVFSSQVVDILFSLRHVSGAQRVSGWDDSLAEDVLTHFATLAENVIAPLNQSGDEEGASLVDGHVQMPEGFVDAYRQLSQDGWQGLTAPEEYGGQSISPVIASGVSEIFSGANHSLQMVCNLVPGAISTLLKYGSNDQQSRWIPHLANGTALATMCLTETEAGSDLSAIRCRAEQNNQQWMITGEKIFISGGDQDLSDDILHLVLARSNTEKNGMQGLSLYLCPKQPAASVTRLEKKLGLNASPTCQMRFDGAHAELIGLEGEGLNAMFTLMNHARVDVALQGVAHAAHTALKASGYAAERRQGKTSDGTPARLSDHADVKRMLDEQQTLAISARALCHIALVELETQRRPALIEFLTPLSKIAGSEAGIRSADLAIQVLGGYGYLTDYGVGQHWRDARITAIYEGANGIHAKSLVTRHLHSKTINEFSDLISELGGANETVEAELIQWKKRAEMIASAEDMTRHAHDFSQTTIRLLNLAIWQRIHQVADCHPTSGDTLVYLANKIHSEAALTR